MARSGWVRTIYLYLFALLGLVFIAIGAIRFLDLGLRTFVFRQADAMERWEQPPFPALTRRPGELDTLADRAQLTAEEKRVLREAIAEYQRWEQRRSRINPVTARRQRDASSSLALILVGLPLYLYHWRTIKREAEERRQLAVARKAATTLP